MALNMVFAQSRTIREGRLMGMDIHSDHSKALKAVGLEG
jgi:hypothetical protein